MWLDTWTEELGKGRGHPRVGRTFWPLLTSCPDPCLALLPLGGSWGGPPNLVLWGQLAGLREDHDLGTFKCSGGSLDH